MKIQALFMMNYKNIYTNKNKKMSKKKEIIRMAVDLILKNGSTTTMEIKHALRETQPNTNWVQSTVSKNMQRAYANGDISLLQYTDNGNYRTYFISPAQAAVNASNTASAGSVKTYTYSHNSPEGSISISGSKELVESVATNANWPIRFSVTKDTFVNITEMHDVHLLNALKKDIKDIDSLEEFANYITSRPEVYNAIDRKVVLKKF